LHRLSLLVAVSLNLSEELPTVLGEFGLPTQIFC